MKTEYKRLDIRTEHGLKSIDVWSWIKNEAVDARMIMQVHDELVFEIPESQLDDYCNKLKAIMEDAAELSVPLIADVGVGDNWDVLEYYYKKEQEDK